MPRRREVDEGGAREEIPARVGYPQRDKLAWRQANALITLAMLGQADPLWPAMKRSPDHRVRSYLLGDGAPGPGLQDPDRPALRGAGSLDPLRWCWPSAIILTMS